MRYSLIIFSLVVLANFSLSAQEKSSLKPIKLKPTKSPNQVTISGRIWIPIATASGIDSLAFRYEDIVSNQTVIIPIKRDKEGNFKMKVPFNVLQELELTQAVKNPSGSIDFGATELDFLVAPGLDLHIDYQSLEDVSKRSLNFSGTGGVLNQQRGVYEEAFEREFYTFMDWEAFNGTVHSKITVDSLSRLKQRIATRLEEGLAFNKHYFLVNKITPTLQKYLDESLRYEAANYYLQALLKTNTTDPQLDVFFKQNGVVISNPNAMGMDQFERVIGAYHYYLKRQMVKPNTEVTLTFKQIAEYIMSGGPDFDEEARASAKRVLDTVNRITEAENTIFANKYFLPLANRYLMTHENNLPEFDAMLQIKDPFIKDLLASRILYRNLKLGQVDVVTPNLKNYNDKVSSIALKKQFQEDYKKAYDQQYLTKIPAGAKLYANTELEGGDLINKLTEKYPGKAIYIDVWATWCAPCLAEMPAAKKLRKQFAGKDVVFVYLCMSSPLESTWKARIGEYQIEGEHFRLSEDLAGPFRKKFDIGFIPRQLLINKTGSVVNADAKGPGETDAAAEIQQVL